MGEWYPGLASTAMIKYLDTKANLSLGEGMVYLLHNSKFQVSGKS